MADETITAIQGSQPTVAGLRIGIMDAATFDGVSKARLLLRPPGQDIQVVLAVGETHDLTGVGSVTLVSVAADDPQARPQVTLRVVSD
ncbi:hypothetical protein ASD65_09610 [Microbacterium sp. Root61]|uniref:hypothetical protein n=1 Tax=Microbacterium sp. Root61 TaxID=1736570 RepID=UPI0007020FB7|nr:hypothetical protein [Microbacterium sp. Root61]KRA24636.1 hypothetical protein ASD65_09610 [Microbacterium sp. Root61]